MPTSLRISSRFFFSSSRGIPSITMAPLSISSSPLRHHRNVDFPEPDGPIITTTSLRRICVEKSQSARTPLGKDLFTLSTVIIKSPSCFCCKKRPFLSMKISLYHKTSRSGTPDTTKSISPSRKYHNEKQNHVANQI